MNFPADLRARRQWVAWRAERRDGKPTKVPYCVTTGQRASSTNPETWTTFETAAAFAQRHADGVGFVFTANDPFCGVDLDNCVGDAHGLHPAAAEIVERLSSYTELSPSGTGVHVIVRAELPAGARNRTSKTPWGGTFECYDRDRFFTMTGESIELLPNLEVEPRQEELEHPLAELFPAPSKNGAMAPARHASGRTDGEVLERAFAAKNGPTVQALYRGAVAGYGSRSEADLALCALLAFWTGPDPEQLDRMFRGSGLMREKWDRADYRESTIAKALQGADFFDWETRPVSATKTSAVAESISGLPFATVGETSGSSDPNVEDGVGVSGGGLGLNTQPSDEHFAADASYLTDFTDIIAKPVRWAWRDRVALAKITGLAGRPKIGKGLLYSHLIAHATRGRLDGDLAEPRNVILVTTEDEPGDTLKPRLMAAGADLSRVSMFQMGSREEPVPFRVPQDADELGGRVAGRNAALVVVDPLMEFIDGKVDSHKSHPVRQAVAALNQVAREHGCAVVVIFHLNKGVSTDPLLRHEGSAAFTQVVRGGLMLGQDPDDPDGEDGRRRVLAVSSSNLAPIAKSLVYRIETSTVDGDTGEPIQTARMVHVGESDANGHDLLRGRDADGEPGALEDAKCFLNAELADGHRLARDVTREAKGIGISEMTLKRARGDLGVTSDRIGEPGVRGGGAWYWSLPIKGVKGDENLHSRGADPLNAKSLVERGSGGSESFRGSRLNGDPLNPAGDVEQAEIDRIQAKFGGGS